MKNIICFVVILIAFSACNSLVEEEVFSTVTPGNFFRNEKDVSIAVNGVYDGLQRSNAGHTDINAYMAGEFDNQWTPQFMTLIINNTYGALWSVWTDNYKTIGKANVVLAELEKSDVAEAVKNQYAGEVRFLRAYCYFEMVRIFGHFPLVTTPPSSLDQVVLPDTTKVDAYESEYLRQVDRDEIYNFIIEDLKFCEQNLPATYNVSNLGRATKGAASGMLARVYLAQAGYQYDYNSGGLKPGDASKFAMCAQKCQEIISSGTYTLLPDYASIFLNSNDNNNECLFSIQFLSSAEVGVTGEGSEFAPDYGIKGADVTPYSYNWNTVNLKYYTDWVAQNGMTDKRYATTFITEYVNKKGQTIKYGTGNFRGPMTGKLVSDIVLPISAQGAKDYGDNFIVQRYADVLLMHSEALNESGSTPDANTIMGVNMVRARAGKAVLTLPVTKAQLQEEIWNERKWELCFEGFYSFYDCQRTGRYLTEIAKYTNVKRKVVPDEKYYIMPIPFNATEANRSLKQNFGW